MTITTATAASIAVGLHQLTAEPVAEVLTMYRRCSCDIPGAPNTKIAGRACRFCLEQKWTKCCVSCFGLGTLHKQARTGGQDRTERCGKCMGIGWIPCPRVEIPLAEEEERAIAMGAENPLLMEKLADDGLVDQPKRKKKSDSAVTSTVITPDVIVVQE